MNSTVQYPTLNELRKTPHWSFSSINALANFCSLSWAFKYVYKVEPLHTPVNLVFGGAFHATLSFWASRVRDGQACSLDDLDEVFAARLTHEARNTEPQVKFPENEDLYTMIEKGQKMLRAYVESFNPEDRILGVGVPFSVPLVDGAGKMLSKPLIGEFDLTVVRDGVFTIVDWKTAAKKWPEDKARTDLQPTCYLYANYRDTGNTAAGFRFDVVTKTKAPQCLEYPTKRTTEDFARLGQLVRVLERTIANECFIPNDTSWECKNCPYSIACAGWHRKQARSYVHFELAA